MSLVPNLLTDPTEAAFYALVRSTVLARRVMEPYFARHGISGAQWGVLRVLHQAESDGAATNGHATNGHVADRTADGDGNGNGVRMTDLSARLLVRTPSITGVVARLERLGLVRRDVSADDHRARRLRLTPAGRRLTGQLLDGHARRMESLLAPLAVDQRQDLARLLGRVADHLEVLAGEEVSGYRSDGVSE